MCRAIVSSNRCRLPIVRTRVLEQTMPGLFSARLLHVHEPQSSIMLTTVKNLKKFSNRDSSDSETEIEAVIELLNAHDDLRRYP